MGYTDKYREQHDDILRVAGEISEMLKGQPDPVVVRRLLSGLVGKVNFHLAMEDKGLYPRLLQAKDPAVQQRAGKFQKEMGGLGRVFTDYHSKWQLAAIREDLRGFAEETRKVFGALTKRIERENAELYPLAERAA